MAESNVTYIYKNTCLPGEPLRDWMTQWKALTPKDQDDLREWAKAEISS